MKKFEIFQSGVVLNCLMAGKSFVVSREKRVCFEGAPSEEQKLETVGNSKITGAQDNSLLMPEFIQDQSADQYRATINNEWAQTQSFYLDTKVYLEKEVGRWKKTDKADDTQETIDKNKALNDRLDALKDRKLDELKSKLVALGQARAENALKFRDSLTKKMLDYRKAEEKQAEQKQKYEDKLTVKGTEEGAQEKPDVKPLVFELGAPPNKRERTVDTTTVENKSVNVLSGIGLSIYINQGEQAAQEFLSKLEAEAKKQNQGYTNEALDGALGKPAMKYLESFRNYTIDLPAPILGKLIGNLHVAEKMFEKNPKLLERYKQYLKSLVGMPADNALGTPATLTQGMQGPREWALHNAEAELKDLEIKDEELDSLFLERVKEKCSVVKDAAARKDAEQKIFAHLVAWRDGLKAKSETIDIGQVDGTIDNYIVQMLGYEKDRQQDDELNFANYRLDKRNNGEKYKEGNQEKNEDGWKAKWAKECLDQFLESKPNFTDENSKTAFYNAMLGALQSYEDIAWQRDATSKTLEYVVWENQNNGWYKFLDNKWAEWKMVEDGTDQAAKISTQTDARMKKLGLTEDKLKIDKPYARAFTQMIAGLAMGADKNFEDKGEIGKKALADYQKYLLQETNKGFSELNGKSDADAVKHVTDVLLDRIKSAEQWWNSVMVPQIAAGKMKTGETKEEKKDEKKKGEGEEKKEDKDKKDDKEKDKMSPEETKVRAEAAKHLQSYLGNTKPEDGKLVKLNETQYAKDVAPTAAGVTLPEGFTPKNSLLAEAMSVDGKGKYQILFVSKDVLKVLYLGGEKLDEKKEDKDKSKDKGKVEGGNANAKGWLEKYRYNPADFKDRTNGQAGKYMASNQPTLDVSNEKVGAILATTDTPDGTLQMKVQKGKKGNILTLLLVPSAAKSGEPKKDDRAPAVPGGRGVAGATPEGGEAKAPKKKVGTDEKGDVGSETTGSRGAKTDVKTEKGSEGLSDKQQTVARLTHEFVAGGAQGTKKPEEVVKDLAAYLNSKNLLNATDSFTYSGVSYGDHLLIVQAKNGKFSVRLGAEVKRPLWKDEVAPTSEPDPQEKERKISEARNKITSALQPKFDSLAKEISASVNKKESTYFQSGNFVKEAIQSKIQSDLQSLTGGLSQEIAMVKDEGGFRLNGMTLEYKVDDKNTKTASLNYLCLPGSTTPGAAVVLGTRTVG